MIPLTSLEGFILAGGKSSRMGTDKGLVLFRKKPMITHIMETLQSIDLPFKIIANDTSYSSLSAKVIPDRHSDMGPMAGLYTALEETRKSHILLLSCDMPLLPDSAIRLLAESATEGLITVASIGRQINPMIAIYPKKLVEAVNQSLRLQKLKMRGFIADQKHETVPLDHLTKEAPYGFENVNTMMDLMRLENSLSSSDK